MIFNLFDARLTLPYIDPVLKIENKLSITSNKKSTIYPMIIAIDAFTLDNFWNFINPFIEKINIWIIDINTNIPDIAITAIAPG
jgi:hypothetical protein